MIILKWICAAMSRFCRRYDTPEQSTPVQTCLRSPSPYSVSCRASLRCMFPCYFSCVCPVCFLRCWNPFSFIVLYEISSIMQMKGIIMLVFIIDNCILVMLDVGSARRILKRTSANALVIHFFAPSGPVISYVIAITPVSQCIHTINVSCQIF